MMKSFFIGLLIVGVLFSCTREENLSTLTGTRKLTAYQQIETGAIEMEPSNLDRSIEIQFSDKGLTGTISGYTVTNLVFGKYTLQSGGLLTIAEVGGTMVGEPEWGMHFRETFYQAQYYEAYSDQLIIFNKQHTEKMIFQRK